MQNKINAGFFVRLAAYIVDVCIVGVALLAIRIPVWVLSLFVSNNWLLKELVFQYTAMDIICYVLRASYFIVLTYRTGTTLGKRLFHLRVQSTQEQEITLFEVMFRETVGRFLSKIFVGIGYLLIIVQREKRGLHDLLSDTEVVYYHEKRVYVETVTQETTVSDTYVPATYEVEEKIE